MTLTPAIREKLDRLYASVRCTDCFGEGPDNPCPVCGATGEEESALLSVVAAEEGRKYEEGIAAKDTYILSLRDHFVKETDKLKTLVKLHREWVEATKAAKDHDFGHAYHLGGDPEGAALVAAAEAAFAALAQWEAK